MQKDETYKCSICGNVVLVKEVGGGTLVCCDKNMDLLTINNSSENIEDMHIPVIEVRKEREIYIKIGEVTHPMTENHYIKWIEISVDGALYVKSLNPWDKAEALFKIPSGRKIAVRAMCNVHGVFKKVYGQ